MDSLPPYPHTHSLTGIDDDNVTDSIRERRASRSLFNHGAWENATVPYVFDKGLRKSVYSFISSSKLDY